MAMIICATTPMLNAGMSDAAEVDEGAHASGETVPLGTYCLNCGQLPISDEAHVYTHLQGDLNNLTENTTIYVAAGCTYSLTSAYHPQGGPTLCIPGIEGMCYDPYTCVGTFCSEPVDPDYIGVIKESDFFLNLSGIQLNVHCVYSSFSEPTLGEYVFGSFQENTSSESSPYTHVEGNIFTLEDTVYVSKGATYELHGRPCLDGSDCSLAGTAGDSPTCYVGTFDQTGEVVMEGVTFVVVGDTTPLEFLSDPADGILIPPNHHLVTFVYIDGITVYRVVEHGEYLEDVPATEYLWYSSRHGFADVPIQITSDVVYHEQYSGGGSQIG